MLYNLYVLVGRAVHELIGPIPPNWAPRWSYLLTAVQVHTTTHCRFLQRTALGPAPLRPAAGGDGWILSFNPE